VERRVQLVRSAEQSLASARADLDSAEKTLLSTAQQAMGYARIYAQDRPELLANLEAISLPGRQRELPMTPMGSPTRPRGRPSRSRSDVQSGQLQVGSTLVDMDSPLATLPADQPGGLSDTASS
jgi:multidrug efflux pump subunit AcrA (membrane-fusion protein)